MLDIGLLLDIAILLIGFWGLVNVINREIKKFRNGNFNPNILTHVDKSGSFISRFLTNFSMLAPGIIIELSLLKGLFYLVLSICFLVTINVLRFKHYRLHKNLDGILELVLFNIIFILIAAWGGWVAFGSMPLWKIFL